MLDECYSRWQSSKYCWPCLCSYFWCCCWVRPDCVQTTPSSPLGDMIYSSNAKGLRELRLLVSLVISWFVVIVISYLWFLRLNFRIEICLSIISKLLRPKWNLKILRKRWWCFKEWLGALGVHSGQLFVCIHTALESVLVEAFTCE